MSYMNMNLLNNNNNNNNNNSNNNIQIIITNLDYFRVYSNSKEEEESPLFNNTTNTNLADELEYKNGKVSYVEDVRVQSLKCRLHCDYSDINDDNENSRRRRSRVLIHDTNNDCTQDDGDLIYGGDEHKSFTQNLRGLFSSKRSGDDNEQQQKDNRKNRGGKVVVNDDNEEFICRSRYPLILQTVPNSTLLVLTESDDPCTLLLVNIHFGNNIPVFCRRDNLVILRKRTFLNAIVRVEVCTNVLIVLTDDGQLYVLQLNSLSVRGSVNVLRSDQEDIKNVAYKGEYFAVSPPCFTNNQSLSSLFPNYSWIVCRSKEKIGAVSLLDFERVQLENVFCAHENEIACMAIGNYAPSKYRHQCLATASEKGTMIRVWSVPGCQLLHTLRRGTSPCTIFSLSIDTTGSFIAVSGSSGTIHLYSFLDEQPDEPISRVLSSNSNHTHRTGSAAVVSKGYKSAESHSRAHTKIKLKKESMGGSVARNQVQIVSEGGDDYSRCLTFYILNDDDSGTFFTYVLSDKNHSPRKIGRRNLFVDLSSLLDEYLRGHAEKECSLVNTNNSNSRLLETSQISI